MRPKTVSTKIIETMRPGDVAAINPRDKIGTVRSAAWRIGRKKKLIFTIVKKERGPHIVKCFAPTKLRSRFMEYLRKIFA